MRVSQQAAAPHYFGLRRRITIKFALWNKVENVHDNLLDHVLVEMFPGDTFVTNVMGVITDRCVRFKSTTSGYIRFKQVLSMRNLSKWWKIPLFWRD